MPPFQRDIPHQTQHPRHRERAHRPALNRFLHNRDLTNQHPDRMPNRHAMHRLISRVQHENTTHHPFTSAPHSSTYRSRPQLGSTRGDPGGTRTRVHGFADRCLTTQPRDHTPRAFGRTRTCNPSLRTRPRSPIAPCRPRALGATRTRNHLLRRQELCPVELRRPNPSHIPRARDTSREHATSTGTSPQRKKGGSNAHGLSRPNRFQDGGRRQLSAGSSPAHQPAYPVSLERIELSSSP